MKNKGPYKILKNWLPRFIVVATILLILLTLYFIYNNVWLVFSQLKSAELQEKIAPAELKIDLFEKISENLENKKNQEPIDLETLQNPFKLIEGENEKIEIR